MNQDKLLDLFGETWDAYVEEAIASRKAAPRANIQTRRILLIAAAVTLAVLTVGCGIVYLLNMQNLKLGNQQVTQEYWDEDRGTMAYETVSQQVLTFSGLKGSTNYEAARQWYEFKRTYDPDYTRYHENKASENPYQAPEAYSLYNIYTREMQTKIDEITEKYGLKLLGKPVDAFCDEALLDYLGIDGVLLPDAPASWESFNSAYYDGGWFHTDMNMKLEDNPDWPFQFLCSLYYCPKDCFDPSVCELDDIDDWQEWNYTTASGSDVLVIRSPSVWVSWIFCDRGDAAITLRIETVREWYGDNGAEKRPMTDEQLCQVLDTIDFSIRPQPGDAALLKGPAAGRDLTQTQNGYAITIKEMFTDGSRVRFTLGISAPEGTDLERFVEMKDGGIRFDVVTFTSEENAQARDSSVNHGPRLDEDGKANTIEYYIDIQKRIKDGIAFREGSAWRLYLDDLLVQVWNRELMQWERMWESEGIWNFALTLDQGDWREVEFVDDSIAASVCTGWDADGNDVVQEVTITSFRLSTFGGTYASTWDQGQLDFANVLEEKYPTVMLTDGSAIRLQGDLELYDAYERIPLDEVDHILLTDGTKLYPQN